MSWEKMQKFVTCASFFQKLNYLVNLNVGKTQLVSFDQSKNTGAVEVKIDGSALRRNHLLRFGRVEFLF